MFTSSEPVDSRQQQGAFQQGEGWEELAGGEKEGESEMNIAQEWGYTVKANE